MSIIILNRDMVGLANSGDYDRQELAFKRTGATVDKKV